MCLPPLCYSSSIYLFEHTLAKYHYSKIENVYISDSKSLLEGNTTLVKEINKNIDRYLSVGTPALSSIHIVVSVVTEKGKRLYPRYSDDFMDMDEKRDFFGVAADNYSLLNDGLKLDVSVSIEPNSILSATIFIVFLGSAMFFLYIRYIAAVKRDKINKDKIKNEVLQLRQFENENSEKLDGLSEERKHLQESVDILRKKVNEGNRNEEGMFDEIIRLENELDVNSKSQLVQQDEITQLSEQIEKLKYGKKSGGQKFKVNSKILRRFKALYKKIHISERAVEGYADLDEDLKLKCEEVIFKLNEAPESVPIKRKVFGRKGRETVLEVVFSYKGRLYFRKNKNGNVEVLAIGTKNSQEKELQFLDKL